MRLYYFPIAPNPTKVRIYLAEKGIEIEQVLVNLVKGEQKSPEHLARNPFGNLPVLELDDGSHLTESLAIIELFEELYPDPPMIGTDPFERARVRRLERIADLGVLIPVARIIHATRSPLGLPPVPEIAEAARRSLPKALEILDAADRRPSVPGGGASRRSPTAPSSQPSDSRASVRSRSTPRYRNLARWSADFGQRPSANL